MMHVCVLGSFMTEMIIYYLWSLLIINLHEYFEIFQMYD
jgi:hypothetical protein